MKNTKKIQKSVVDENQKSGRDVYQIETLKEAKALQEALKKLVPSRKFYLSDFI